MRLAALFLASILPLVPGDTERQHQLRLAPKYGVSVENIEFRLWDRTRVDLLSEQYAIEIDWAKKWPEAIGQSLWYSIVTNRKPAIILLVKDGEDRFAYRCQTVCSKYGIRLFVERVE